MDRSPWFAKIETKLLNGKGWDPTIRVDPAAFPPLLLCPDRFCIQLFNAKCNQMEKQNTRLLLILAKLITTTV